MNEVLEPRSTDLCGVLSVGQGHYCRSWSCWKRIGSTEKERPYPNQTTGMVGRVVVIEDGIL